MYSSMDVDIIIFEKNINQRETIWRDGAQI